MHQIHCLQRSGTAIQEEEVTRLEVPGDVNGKLQRKWEVTTPNGQACVRASADLRPQTQEHK